VTAAADISERLVFHPDYTYSDFIGQILPNVDEDGQVSYKFTPGSFTKYSS
jgi:5-methylcytosine-specific restriction endonuclease McrBC GTP-binding regulatory subunit McrB